MSLTCASGFATPYLIRARNSEENITAETPVLQKAWFYGRVVVAEIGLFLLFVTSLVESIVYKTILLFDCLLECCIPHQIEFMRTISRLDTHADANIERVWQALFFDNNIFSPSFNCRIDSRSLNDILAVRDANYAQLSTLKRHRAALETYSQFATQRTPQQERHDAKLITQLNGLIDHYENHPDECVPDDKIVFFANERDKRNARST